jgi:ABC-type hemin transport system ATPase subunit
MIVSDLLSGLRDSLLLFISASGGRALRRLRQAWGKEGAKDPWLVTWLFDLTRDRFAEVIDDKTWVDLELDRVFTCADCAITPLGSQFLYRKFRTPVADTSQLDAEYATCCALREDAAAREQIQLKLLGLSADSNAHICGILFGQEPEKLRFAPLILLASAVSLACLALALLNHSLWWIFAIVVGVNFFLMMFLGHHAHDAYMAIQGAGRMVQVAGRLARMADATRLPDLTKLREVLVRCPELKRSFGFINVARGDSLVASLLFYLNLVFLLDLVLATFMAKWLHARRAPLREVFELVGALDASIAIASLMERLPAHCRPTVTSDQAIHLTDAYHPLIGKPVANSIHLDGRSALVVGTNMAGKTTFIKMVGANIVLGRTLGACFAASAVIPDAPVMAAVRAEHSIQSGKSHFFAEIERILSFVRLAGRARRGVFLLDEPFRGTNTRERIAIARAVLAEIGAHAQVLATTHDVELQQLLGDRFMMFHFTEDPDLPEVFDYRLRPGASGSRNAIRLLEKIGFPPSVVAEARRTASQASRTPF